MYKCFFIIFTTTYITNKMVLLLITYKFKNYFIIKYLYE